MSELNYLQFQPIDSSSDDLPEEHRHQDEIVLDDGIDEEQLDHYWDEVVQDIHQDPDWFTFTDE
ncbi:MAG: hypothetical protein NTV39_03520 [Candidatus Saccharibacteria bacterium]|nr:hypothetical protein [Candidatus Saccharibacteria bacterium]